MQGFIALKHTFCIRSKGEDALVLYCILSVVLPPAAQTVFGQATINKISELLLWLVLLKLNVKKILQFTISEGIDMRVRLCFKKTQSLSHLNESLESVAC